MAGVAKSTTAPNTWLSHL